MTEPAQFSMLALLLAADPVVKAVMAVLVTASVVSWALAFETARRQARVRRMMREAATAGLGSQAVLASQVLGRAVQSAEIAIPGETGGEFLARIERAMREGAGKVAAATDAGLTVLATIAAVAPFVGLLGTVWGVMNSFTAIAGANDTSLATVAPGIAEALFTTALGLFAAIPAVVAFNRLGAARASLGRLLDAAIRREAEVLASRRSLAPAHDTPFRAAAE